MIRRHGHYIRGSYCIKCDRAYYKSDMYASKNACFKEPCTGKWKHQVDFLEREISRNRKELCEVRKWMAFDHKKKGRK